MTEPTTLPEILRAMNGRGARPVYTFVDQAGAIVEQHDGPSLLRKAAYIARDLLAAGHRRGDRVILAYSPESPGFVPGFWGTVLAGGVPVPMAVPDPRLGAAGGRTFRHIAADCGATTALADRTVQAMMTVIQGKDRLAGLVGLGEGATALSWRSSSGELPAAESAAMLEEAVRLSSPEDPAFLQYTSGSTTQPRGVLVRHRNVVFNVQSMNRAMHANDRSVVVGWMPMYHDAGLTGAMFTSSLAGGHLVVCSPFTFLQNPEVWLDLLERFGATHTASPDFGYRYLLKHVTPGKQWKLGTLVGAVQGGEPLQPATVRAMVDRFAASGLEEGHFVNVFGMAEMVLWVCGNVRLERPTLRIARKPFERGGRIEPVDADGVELVSCGTPERELGTDVIAVDPETRVPLGPDRVGELWVTGRSVCDGYWGRSTEENRERFAAEVVGEDRRTFLRTGDLGFIHDGRVFVCGRHKDMLILAGRNLYPQDLEVTITESDPSIRRGCVAVVGLPADPDERIGLLVELKEKPADPVAVVRRIQAALAADHRLGAHGIVLLRKDTLLKTSSGKLRRSACRDAWIAGSFASAAYFEMGMAARPAEGLRSSLSWLVGGLFGGAPAESAAPVADDPSPEGRLRAQLRALAAAQMGLHPSEIDVDKPLADQGFDSVRLLSFAEAAGGLLDVEIHPNAAMNHPTVRALASHLVAKDWSKIGLLAPIRADGTEPPLVFLPPIGGHTLWCMDLCRELRPSLPVWAFVAPEYVEGHPSPETVDDQVRGYVAELVERLDAPSFRIGGYSLGSTLALETARQLVAAGRKVDGVLLLGGALVRSEGPPDPKRASIEIARQLGVPTGMMGQFEKMGFEAVIQQFAARTKMVSPGAPEDLEKKMLAAAKGAMGRTMRWTPRPVSAPVAMLRPDHGDDPAASDREWAKLAEGAFEVVIVPGDHASMIRAPHAEALARHLERTIDGWTPGSAGASIAGRSGSTWRTP